MAFSLPLSFPVSSMTEYPLLFGLLADTLTLWPTWALADRLDSGCPSFVAGV